MTIRLMGVVLCGGQSSRMGREKSTLSHPDGGTYLDHAVSRLSPLCADVCLSAARKIDSPHRVVTDHVPGGGPAVGIAAALAMAGRESFDGCLVTPIDMPHLSQDDLSSICQQWRRDPKLLVCGVCEPGNQLQPLVAIYPIGVGRSLTKLVDSSDRSLVRWINRQSYVAVPLPFESCHNVNSPEDLESGPEIPV